MSELGERAVRCSGFKWLPGMLDLDGMRALRERREFAYGVDVLCIDEGIPAAKACAEFCNTDDMVPDLEDAATLGCLLKLVREAWGEPVGVPLTVTHMGGYDSYEWVVCGIGPWTTSPGLGSTEGEALVAALEAAPGAK